MQNSHLPALLKQFSISLNPCWGLAFLVWQDFLSILCWFMLWIMAYFMHFKSKITIGSIKNSSPPHKEAHLVFKRKSKQAVPSFSPLLIKALSRDQSVAHEWEHWLGEALGRIHSCCLRRLFQERYNTHVYSPQRGSPSGLSPPKAWLGEPMSFIGVIYRNMGEGLLQGWKWLTDS